MNLLFGIYTTVVKILEGQDPPPPPPPSPSPFAVLVLGMDAYVIGFYATRRTFRITSPPLFKIIGTPPLSTVFIPPPLTTASILVRRASALPFLALPLRINWCPVTIRPVSCGEWTSELPGPPFAS